LLEITFNTSLIKNYVKLFNKHFYLRKKKNNMKFKVMISDGLEETCLRGNILAK